MKPYGLIIRMSAAWISRFTKAALLLAAVAVPRTPAVAQAVTNVIFPVTQVWSYMTTASDTSFCLNGTGWEQPGYDDSAWLTGPGGFTGGENTASTLTSLAGLLNTTSLPAPVTSSGRPQYFRTHFNIASTNNLTWLVLSNRIDDQAVFYLNGTRVADYRHPNNPESCTPGGAGGDEATVWVVITLYPSNWVGVLQPGDNVLAASVHQNAATSSDMVFVSLLSSVSGTIVIPPPIVFGNSGVPTITFDSLPPPQQWSTFRWAGANTGITDFNGLDAAAKTNDASVITASLASVTNNPPTDNNVGIWSQAAQAIGTRPVGVAYSGFMATLSNATASAITSVGIRYDFTVFSTNAPGSEQIPGELVYYSTTGAPGSWTQIPELSDAVNDETSGTYVKCVNLTLNAPWNPGAKLYILWVDDNANPLSPDDSYQIDNVAFYRASTATTLVFLNDSDMTNRTIAQCQSTTFSAGSAIGQCSSTFNPLGYQWYKMDVSHPNGAAIRGATNTSYTIADVQPADAGVYFVRAAGIEAFGESHHATLTVTPAPTFAAVKAVASTNQTNIVVSFNLPVDPASVDPNGSDIDVRPTGGGPSLGVVGASVLNGTNVLVAAGSPMAAGAGYEVQFKNTGVGNTCTTNKIIGNFPVATAVVIQIDPVFQRADLIWLTGVLQWNTNLSRGIGWTDVPGSGNVGLATSPYTVYWEPGNGPGKANGTNQMFFRLRF